MYQPPMKSTGLKHSVTIRAVAKGSNNTIADDKERWIVPQHLHRARLRSVKAHVDTAGVTGTQDVQLHNLTNAADILSTKSIVASGSRDGAAGVVDPDQAKVAHGDIIRIDCDAIHTGTAAQGLSVTLEFDL